MIAQSYLEKGIAFPSDTCIVCLHLLMLMSWSSLDPSWFFFFLFSNRCNIQVAQEHLLNPCTAKCNCPCSGCRTQQTLRSWVSLKKRNCYFSATTPQQIYLSTPACMLVFHFPCTISTSTSISCFKCTFKPQTVLCPRGLSYSRAYQRARSSWGLTWTCPGSDAMGQAVSVSPVSPALVLSSQGRHPSEVASIPTSFQKRHAVRTGQVFQVCLKLLLQLHCIRSDEKAPRFQSAPLLGQVKSSPWKKKGKTWGFLLLQRIPQTLSKSGVEPTLPPWTPHFFKTAGAWLLAPFSSTQSPSHTTDKIRYSHRVTIRPRAVDPSPRPCLLRPSFSSRFGSQVI